MTIPPDLVAQVTRTVTAARYSITTTGSYAMTSADRYIRADGSTGPLTITLPPAIQMVGEYLRIVKVDASATVVTIQTQSPDTIGSAELTTITLTDPDQSVTLRAWRSGDQVNYDTLAVSTGSAAVLVDFWGEPPHPFVDGDPDLAFAEDDEMPCFDDSLSFL